MLKDLKILNGELSLKFDPLNTRYTVNMTTEDTKLELEYEIDEDDEISIFGNSLDGQDDLVVISVYNDEDMMSYYLEINPLESENVNMEQDYFASLEVDSNKEIPGYVAPLIAGVCFLIILFFFAILFKKRKIIKQVNFAVQIV